MRWGEWVALRSGLVLWLSVAQTERGYYVMRERPLSFGIGSNECLEVLEVVKRECEKGVVPLLDE